MKYNIKLYYRIIKYSNILTSYPHSLGSSIPEIFLVNALWTFFSCMIWPSLCRDQKTEQYSSVLRKRDLWRVIMGRSSRVEKTLKIQPAVLPPLCAIDCICDSNLRELSIIVPRSKASVLISMRFPLGVGYDQSCVVLPYLRCLNFSPLSSMLFLDTQSYSSSITTL